MAHFCRCIAVGTALGLALAAILFRLSENFDANLMGF